MAAVPRRLLLIAAAAALPVAAQRAAPTSVPRAEEYGWSGVINSRLNDGVFRLLAADVDSDGDNDLAVVNNPKARLDFLLQRKPGEPLKSSQATQAGEKTND